jgi:hypothetical protein
MIRPSIPPHNTTGHLHPQHRRHLPPGGSAGLSPRGLGSRRLRGRCLPRQRTHHRVALPAARVAGGGCGAKQLLEWGGKLPFARRRGRRGFVAPPRLRGQRRGRPRRARDAAGVGGVVGGGGGAGGGQRGHTGGLGEGAVGAGRACGVAGGALQRHARGEGPAAREARGFGRGGKPLCPRRGAGGPLRPPVCAHGGPLPRAPQALGLRGATQGRLRQRAGHRRPGALRQGHRPGGACVSRLPASPFALRMLGEGGGGRDMRKALCSV